MLFNYKAANTEGKEFNGNIEAPSIDLAVSSLQRRNLIIVSINPVGEKVPFWKVNLSFFNRINQRDVVVLSRQLSTLFEAEVPVLVSFRLLADETENILLREKLNEIVDDIRGGFSISSAMEKHPEVFSKFFVNMVKAGEEAGKLEETFLYLADYLERSYELSSRAKRALIYPAFVIFAFIAVMILMLVFIMPRLNVILNEVGEDVPFYTQIIMGFSNFLVEFGVYILIIIAVGAAFFWRYLKTNAGEDFVSRLLISFPYIGLVFRKIYLARFTDNLETLLSGGVSMTRALAITADIVGNRIYSDILHNVAKKVKDGKSMSEALKEHNEIPSLVPQMVRIGEEGGKLNFMLKTLARFYDREVDNAIKTLIGLIEPAMILLLGLMVGFLLISVIGPIYSISSGI